MTTDTELAWAAGFLDGEGHFGFYKSGRSRGRLHIEAAQVRREPLDRLQTYLGGRVYGPYKHGHKQDYYQWMVDNIEKCMEIIALLRPYLSAPKIEQADLSLQKWENRPPKRKPGPKKYKKIEEGICV